MFCVFFVLGRITNMPLHGAHCCEFTTKPLVFFVFSLSFDFLAPFQAEGGREGNAGGGGAPAESCGAGGRRRERDHGTFVCRLARLSFEADAVGCCIPCSADCCGASGRRGEGRVCACGLLCSLCEFRDGRRKASSSKQTGEPLAQAGIGGRRTGRHLNGLLTAAGYRNS